MNLRNLVRFFLIGCSLTLPFTFQSCDKDETGLDTKTGLFWINGSDQTPEATIYYVSPSGQDDQSGKSEDDAFQTLRKAFTAVRPGGSIRILKGIYYESIGLDKFGAEGFPITIEGHQGSPLLDGEQSKSIGIYCENCNNLIFRNLEITAFTDMGFGFTNGKNLKLENIQVSDCGNAVKLKGWELEGYGIAVDYSVNIEIIGNRAFRNGPNPQIFPHYLMGTGIDTYGNQDVIIRDNISYDNTGGGYLIEDSESVLFENNEAYGNDLDAMADEWWDGALWVDGGHNIIIRNNYFHDNLGPGIQISDEDNQNPTGYVLENNRSINNYYGIFIWNFGTTDWPDESIIRHSGNVFTSNSILDIWIIKTY